MAYAYTRPFVGIPLNQLYDLKDVECEVLLAELQELCDGEPEGWSPMAEQVQMWFDENRDELHALGVEFQSGYSGGGASPMILGVYVDKLLPVPSFGAGKICLDRVGEIPALLERFKSIYVKLDPQVREIFDRNDLVGMWFNNHSS